MIKIRDNQELLVDLLQKCRGIIINRKRNKERVLVRTGVAKRISRAKGLLPKGVTFFMYGGWRSVESQMRI
ncbi:hypothetical protein KJ855_04220, partial [Patescibacteria group bacterium]|nr:hypothetical protein [Patescibacteria group bacterium]